MGEVGPILLSSPLKTPGTFYFFAGTYVLVFLHVLLLLPETKVLVTNQPTFKVLITSLSTLMQGQSLESIERLFAMPWSKRVDILYYLR